LRTPDVSDATSYYISNEKKKNKGSQMGRTKKKFEKKIQSKKTLEDFLLKKFKWQYPLCHFVLKLLERGFFLFVKKQSIKVFMQSKHKLRLKKKMGNNI
jgi:hypothetical protein